MEKTSIVYDSKYGATEAAAKIIKNILVEQGINVDMFRANQFDLSEYGNIIIGSPIRFGRCSSKIRAFIIKNFKILKNRKVTFFFTCMSVSSNNVNHGFPVFIDHQFKNPSKPKARLRVMENTHTTSYYLKQFLKHIPEVTPSSVAFFKGRLDTETLSRLHRLIMRFAMFTMPEIENGDFLEHEIIESWVRTQLNS